ncbi:trypsin-like peptidase domain-containing protein, partial [Bacteroidales bacterium AH-315-I05]|nr:trypsin-like peptidase domain-containing protein [Bacteroidales bacterium AH-315-I05]
MRKCIFFFSFFTFYFLLFTSSLAQLSKGGKPLSFNENYQLKKNVPTEVMPSVDVEKLKAEDSINAQDKSIPWRFGHNFDVNLNLQNSGLWETLPHGDRIWRLKIISHDALSINLQFDDYWLPEGAKLFIYNESKSEIIGAFTDLNNKSFRKLGTTPVHGDKIILEYFEPKKAAGLGTLNISTVTHAYRDIFSLAKGLGDSGPCNNNVVCPEGDNWRDQIRSVAIIIVGGNSGCTGALINNSCEDGTPYFLTANHCLGGSTSTWVFRFHWDSPTCSSTGNGPTNYTISGATLMASNGGSDFALLELSTQIPDSFNVFYAGWDRSGTNPTSQTAIHHPSGDVKKISFDYDPAVSTTWSSAQVWEITQWEDGTTEPGSSGSPLFDQDGRIIGQLFGGGASCGNITDDNYGRVNVSWDNDPTPSKQLKYWLANCDTSVQEIDGYDPNAQSVANDAAAHSVLDIQPLLCGNTIQPKIIFKNKGLDTLISLTIVYDLDGNVLDSVLWSGTLAPNTTDTVSVPIISIANDGSHTFTATVKNPNNSVDSNAVNDSKTVSFYAITNSTDVSFTLNLDDWGSEISWSITDTTGIIVHSGGG